MQDRVAKGSAAQDSWERARREYVSFLDRIDKLRQNLGCYHHNAWFRGTTDVRYELLPALFRQPPGTKLRVADATRRLQKHYRSLLKKLNGELNTLRDDLSDEDKKTGESVKPKQLEINATKKKLNQCISRVETHYVRRFEEAFLGPTLREDESDSFIRYSQRSEERAQRTSWEVLAEMRHHGVPTRLIDWTEALSVAIFFAVRNVRELLEVYWAKDRDNQRNWFEPPITEDPCVWILNPYLLSLYATGAERSSIWDFSFDEGFDYYENFIRGRDGQVSWPYQFPIPIYAPWKDLRIAAQQGVFTVHGTDPRPLDEQRPNKALREKIEARFDVAPKQIVDRIKIPYRAAIYAVRHQIRYEGLNWFVLFRDSDSLGKHIASQVAEVKSWRCLKWVRKGGRKGKDSSSFDKQFP